MTRSRRLKVSSYTMDAIHDLERLTKFKFLQLIFGLCNFYNRSMINFEILNALTAKKLQKGNKYISGLSLMTSDWWP